MNFLSVGQKKVYKRFSIIPCYYAWNYSIGVQEFSSYYNWCLWIQPLLLARCQWGRFARSNVCPSATEILYWWHEICLESGQEPWLVGVVDIVDIVYEWQTCKWDECTTSSQYSWTIFFFRKSIWISLEPVHKRTHLLLPYTTILLQCRNLKPVEICFHHGTYLPKNAKTITNQALDGPLQLQWSMTAFKVWTWRFNLFVAAMLLSNYTPKINMHKTNPRFSVTWILINLHISLNMEGHLVLASRGIMSYYVWIFFTKKYSISYHKYPPLPNQWWIQGRGLGGPGSPLISLFLDQTEARRTEKIFFSLSKGLDDLP